MITLRKLRSLPRKTRLRKILTLLEEWGRDPRGGTLPEAAYLRAVMDSLSEDERLPQLLRETAARLREAAAAGLPPGGGETTGRKEGARGAGEAGRAGGEGEERPAPDRMRELEHLRFGLMEYLGATPADWDFHDRDSRLLSRREATLLPLRVYLDDIRSPFNVGSIFRTAEAFGAERIHLSAYTADPEHKRARRTAMGCVELLPWSRTELNELDEQPFFALEVGGTPVERFSFPSSGIVAVGSEELGISPEVRRRAESSAGIVSIPTGGAKGSLNVAVAFGILMQHWFAALQPGGE
jgi:TrmH family RNA methyltransferase